MAASSSAAAGNVNPLRGSGEGGGIPLPSVVGAVVRLERRLVAAVAAVSFQRLAAVLAGAPAAMLAWLAAPVTRVDLHGMPGGERGSGVPSVMTACSAVVGDRGGGGKRGALRRCRRPLLAAAAPSLPPWPLRRAADGCTWETGGGVGGGTE